MKKRISIFFLLLPLLSIAQDKKDFQSKEFIEKLIKSRTKTMYVRGSMSELTVLNTENGMPVKIKADYKVKEADAGQYIGKILDKEVWIEILYEQGLPYAVTFFNMGRVNALPFEKDKEIGSMFSESEKNKIIQLNKDLLKRNRLASPSYQKIMDKWNSYPASYSMTNNLQEIVFTQTYTQLVKKTVQIDVSRYMEVDEKGPERTSSNSYYKNVSNHPVLIKLIGRSINNNEYIYKDASRVINAGETTTFSTFNKEYNDHDYDDWIQYIGEVGSIKSGDIEKGDDLEVIEVLENAVELRENVLEINSKTNLTNIHCKKGDKIRITASGEIAVGLLSGVTTPDGIDRSTVHYRENGFFYGALIGRIGNGEWFLVGKSASITASHSGVLQLKVNDSDPSDNVGKFIVEYSINK